MTLNRLIIGALLLITSFENCYAVEFRQVAVKAAYLFRLSLFVEWPKIEDESIQFCIAENTEYSKILEKILTDKQINQHPIKVILVNENDDFSHCQLLYIPETVQDVQSYLDNAKPYAILTVGESPEFYRLQGIVYLYTKENKIKFFINNGLANKIGLKIRAQLLQLAEEPS